MQIILIWLVALLMLSPWLYVQSQAMLNGNVTWLLIAADRMIHGAGMAQSIYETNPPLSILLYAPHILVMNTLNLPPEIGPLTLTLTFILLSLTASSRILATFEYLNPLERHTLLIAQTAGLTYMSAIYFMDREHLMLMAMVPFLLAQIALTQEKKLKPALLWPVLILGAIAILVKPQYGLLPAALLLHRMIAQNTLRIFKDPDFVALSTMTVLYIAFVILVFPDYLNTIFPDVLDYYLGSADKAQTLRLFKPHLIMYLVVLLFEVFMTDLEKPKKRLLVTLHSCALLALIPLLVQMKGFYNHLLPAFALFVIALSLTVVFRLERYVFRNKAAKILPVLVPAAILGLVALKVKPAWNYPKGYEVRTLPVAKFLNENCPRPCTFFAFHSDIETMNPTAFYTGYTHGTRFPSYWFMPRMLWQMHLVEKGEPAALSPEKLEKDRQRFGLYAAQDLQNFKPDLLLIGTSIDILGQGDFLDYVDFFGASETFRETLAQHYEKTGTFEFDRAEYFRGTSLSRSLILTYDVYKRKNQESSGTPSSPADLKTNNADPM